LIISEKIRSVKPLFCYAFVIEHTFLSGWASEGEIEAVQYLSEFKTFNDIESLNKAIYDHICAHYYNLNETDRKILKTLGRYAVKYLGAAHLKVVTIAETIGKSEKTVRRSLNKLQKLGIIRKVVTTRKVLGGYGANIYVILPCDQSSVSNRQQSEKPTEVSHKQTKTEAETITIQNYNTVNNINTYKDEPSRFDSPYIAFKRMVNCFVNDNKLTNKLYGVWLAHTRYLRDHYEVNTLLEAGIQAIKVTFQASKRKKLRNIAGYFNGTLDRMLDRLYYEEIKAFYM
jgi:predicted transcriptional regulator